jgi:hypothetical protein
VKASKNAGLTTHTDLTLNARRPLSGVALDPDAVQEGDAGEARGGEAKGLRHMVAISLAVSALRLISSVTWSLRNQRSRSQPTPPLAASSAHITILST